jgi:putative ABC transport system permease protein
MTQMQLTPILSFAWRDLRSSLRGGLRGFRIFLICLALGATVIAGVGSLSTGINAGIADDGKAILGGDLEFRLVYRPASDAELAALQQAGSVSHSLEMRAMVRPIQPAASAETAPPPTLVEAKAVDDLYPLYGVARITPPQDLQHALAPQPDGSFGALIEPTLQQRFNLKTGDALMLGNAHLTVTGGLAHSRH